MEQQNDIILHKWHYKAFNKHLKQKIPNNKDKLIVNKIIKAYIYEPYENEYSEIILSTIYIDKDSTEYFVFDVKYVDDMQVAVQLDKNHILVDNFLVSGF